MQSMPHPILASRQTAEQPGAAASDPAADLRARFRKAKAARPAWETRWNDCFDYTLPLSSELQGRGTSPNQPGRRADALFDGTAADAVDQLAASLLAQLTPPWSRWFAFQPGEEIDEALQGAVATLLDRASAQAQAHIDRSDFAVAAHQCYLDLVTAGTACLAVEEAELGAPSVLRFSAVPIQDVVLEEGPSGRLDTVFRLRRLSPQQVLARYPKAAPAIAALGKQADAETRINVLECVLPSVESRSGYDFFALLEENTTGLEADGLLEQGSFARSPFIAFRWIKAAGDVYGRSPVMKALPDIKTANKVVELVLLQPTAAEDGRLDPDLLRPYGDEALLHQAGGQWQLSIGTRRMLSASCWWDPAYGAPRKGDGSVIAVVFSDGDGHYFLHRVAYLQHDPRRLDEVDAATQLCRQVVAFLRDLHLPAVRIESNGLGKFLPGLLRRALHEAADADWPGAAVIECNSRQAKAARILAAFDAPLAAGAIFAHDSVLASPFLVEMREWRPNLAQARDDGLDAVAGCLLSEPVRLNAHAKTAGRHAGRKDWRPGSGGFKASTDFTP